MAALISRPLDAGEASDAIERTVLGSGKRTKIRATDPDASRAPLRPSHKHHTAVDGPALGRHPSDAGRGRRGRLRRRTRCRALCGEARRRRDLARARRPHHRRRQRLSPVATIGKVYDRPGDAHGHTRDPAAQAHPAFEGAEPSHRAVQVRCPPHRRALSRGSDAHATQRRTADGIVRIERTARAARCQPRNTPSRRHHAASPGPGAGWVEAERATPFGRSCKAKSPIELRTARWGSAWDRTDAPRTDQSHPTQAAEHEGPAPRHEPQDARPSPLLGHHDCRRKPTRTIAWHKLIRVTHQPPGDRLSAKRHRRCRGDLRSCGATAHALRAGEDGGPASGPVLHRTCDLPTMILNASRQTSVSLLRVRDSPSSRSSPW